MNGKSIVINNKIKQSLRIVHLCQDNNHWTIIFLSTNLQKIKNLLLQVTKVTIALLLVFMFYLTMLINYVYAKHALCNKR